MSREVGEAGHLPQSIAEWSPQMQQFMLTLAYICLGDWELPDDPFDLSEWFDAEVR